MKEKSSIRLRLIIMVFLEFAVWGAYLTSMGNYLFSVGLATHIGYFYAIQGVVSLFMPAIIGILADKWIPAQKLLGICHFLAGLFMCCAAIYGQMAGDDVQFGLLFTFYTLSVAFFMPTISLSNSVGYVALEKAGMDIVKDFPPIRVFGTVGFICTMISVDWLGFQNNYMQFYVSGALSILFAFYALSLPNCPTNAHSTKKGWVERLGLDAFKLFKRRQMAVFFIFSMLLGVSLQITNGYANPFITSFSAITEYADTFGVHHANILISLSQVSETLCILLIPFFLRRFGIKKVMLIAMLAWALRFGFFGLGNPGSGVWLFILSMIVYGVAFDFFNISGSLFVEQQTDEKIRASAQGLFMLMTNGLGASIGTLIAQQVVNHYVYSVEEPVAQMAGWTTVWYIFAAYALVVAFLFAIFFKYKHVRPQKKA